MAVSTVSLCILVLVLCCVPGYTDNFFKSSPGLKRTTESQPIEFSWIIDGNIAEATTIHYMYGKEKMCSTLEDAGTVGYGDYSSYTSCQGNGTFTLLKANVSFTRENFSIEITIDGKNFTDATASLFIYRPPIVNWIVPQNITEGDTINITCNASSTSVPASHRQPITFTWELLSQLSDSDSGSEYIIGGDDNGTLTISNIQHLHEKFTCIAREGESPIHIKKSFDIDVQKCLTCDDPEENKNKEGKHTSLSQQNIGLIIGSVVAVVFVILVAIIIYLCWERKHRPDRHKRRSMAVRHSIGRSWTLQRGKHGNGIQGNHKVRRRSVSSDSDSEHFYSEIRTSHIRGEEQDVPALPKRDPNLLPLAALDNSDKLCYEYADARLLGPGVVKQPADTENKPALPDGIYCDDVTDVEARIQKDIEEYMGTGIGNGKTGASKPPHEPTTDTTPSKHAQELYTLPVKKPKQVVPEEDTEDVVVECPAYIPMEQDIDCTVEIPPESTGHNPDIKSNSDETKNSGANGDKSLGHSISEDDSLSPQPIGDEDAGGAYFVAGDSFQPACPEDGAPDLYNLAESPDNNGDSDAQELYRLAIRESQSVNNDVADDSVGDQINQYQLENEI